MTLNDIHEILHDTGLRAAYVNLIAAPILSDDDLNAWADLYQVERLADRITFDLFIAHPYYYCLSLGITPYPHYQYT